MNIGIDIKTYQNKKKKLTHCKSTIFQLKNGENIKNNVPSFTIEYDANISYF